MSSSKISAHLINDYTVGSSNIVAGHPRVLKVLGLDSGWPEGMRVAMRDYKLKAPTGKIVARIYSPREYTLAEDPTVAAEDFWNNILAKSLNYLSPEDRTLIDFLEGPNEGQTPTLGYPASAAAEASRWFNQFWTNLTPRIVAAGYKPCIGSIAVGNPGGDVQGHITAFVPALRQAKAAGGAWSYHSYTIQYTTDVGVEYWYSLRYRQFYEFFAASFPDLANMPLILTEGGVDESGNPNTSGWRARGTAADYQRWLNWFDRQLQQDSYVLGCTLFQNGDPNGWWSFELEPIAAWLQHYLAPPAATPPQPTGVAASTNASGITISWTNAPLSPTTYIIRRAMSSSGPYQSIATNVIEGVRASVYEDKSALPNQTYFYVVSAVNALGEGAPSSPVNARLTYSLPDVVVRGISWQPGVITNGARVVFSAIVQNQGTAPTPEGIPLGVGFNLDNLGTASWSSGHTAALPTNTYITLKADGGPTGNYWTATPGSHVVVATVDDVNRFPELNENNNALSMAFTVPTPPPVITGCFVSNAFVHLTFRVAPFVYYVVQQSETLHPLVWKNGSAFTEAGTNVTFIVPADTDRKFFRLKQLP